jgi:hypothetical protein
MRGRLYATALLALVLALLLATTSAQENHQDSAGVPVGFDADAQAARDAEAYLTPEEKSLIQIGNDLLRGNDTIPDPEDYDVDAVRTRAPVSLTSYAHVPCAPDCGYERVWPDTHLQAPSSRLRVFCYKAATRSVETLANRADVLPPSYGPARVAQVSGLVSDAVGDEWRHYPLGWHWVLVIFGGLVLIPTAAAFCGPKKPPGELVMDAEYGAAK